MIYPLLRIAQMRWAVEHFAAGDLTTVYSSISQLAAFHISFLADYVFARFIELR
jgi:hypothetical protein